MRLDDSHAWALFAAASLSHHANTNDAAIYADHALSYYRDRFPKPKRKRAPQPKRKGAR